MLDTPKSSISWTLWIVMVMLPKYSISYSLLCRILRTCSMIRLSPYDSGQTLAYIFRGEGRLLWIILRFMCVLLP